jgi:hypothetical protein
MTTSVEYREYLRGSAWPLRRAQYERRFPAVCAAGGSTERVQLHHRDYSRLGRERDSDLAWACSCCHVGLERLLRARSLIPRDYSPRACSVSSALPMRAPRPASVIGAFAPTASVQIVRRAPYISG